MINVQLYSIRDRKTEHFNMPFTIGSRANAISYFCTGINNEEISYKNDLELYYLGTMDIETGMITQDNLPEFVISGEEAERINAEAKKEEKK